MIKVRGNYSSFYDLTWDENVRVVSCFLTTWLDRWWLLPDDLAGPVVVAPRLQVYRHGSLPLRHSSGYSESRALGTRVQVTALGLIPCQNYRATGWRVRQNMLQN
jgi:hypothetical protein